MTTYFDEDLVQTEPTFNTDGRPHSRQAEEAVIGAVLIAEETFSLCSFLKPEDFYIQRNGRIWKAFGELREQKSAIDYLTVLTRIEANGDLDYIGGPAYIMGLINQTPSSLNAESYALIVKDTATRRQIIDTASELVKKAFDQSVQVGDIISEGSKKISKAATTRSHLHHWGEDIDKQKSTLDERKRNPVEYLGFPTGFKRFDRATLGLMLGELIFVAGEPGVGKSLWANQLFIQTVAGIGYEGTTMPRVYHAGGLFSLEMLLDQNTRRNLSMIAKVETKKMKLGKVDAVEYARFLKACEAGKKLPIYQTDETRWTLDTLRAEIAWAVDELKVQVVLIDYLHLLVPGVKGRMEEYEKIQLISSEMKAIAKEFKVVVVLINSVTKEAMGKDGQPNQSYLRGGGQLMHDADQIYMITKYINPPEGSGMVGYPAEYHDNLRTVFALKVRDAEFDAGGRFDLYRAKGYPFFADTISARELARFHGGMPFNPDREPEILGV